jgi:predicted nuclease with TOPRIM domain
MRLDQASVRRRFHEASAERRQLMETLRPIHAEHKMIMEQIKALELRAAPLAEAMRPIRNELAELENEIAACARFCRDSEGKSRMGDGSAYTSKQMEPR